jgi:MoxR-like ATPase|tara:strand:- start:448 stop:1413 length:966 start_codon:yes stop_codon:yes gene_type:complete
MSATNDVTNSTDLTGLLDKLEENICQVVLGKRDVIRQCIVALLTGEHVLLEDVPGVGKTLVGRAIARSISGDFCRLQFTPDLLPSDIVGSTVFNSNTSEFLFQKGPVFSNLVLADEINRAPPRTQSALLEAMGDRQVSVDGTTYPLPTPFMVIATQNPFEFEGTYSLPESQLDRFLFRISMGYPDEGFERELLTSHREGEPVEQLQAVLTSDDILQLQKQARQIRVDDALTDYILAIVKATRNNDALQVGVSSRGAISLYRASQSLAMLEKREYVIPDDVKQLAVSSLAHRVMAKGFLQGTQREIVEGIISDIISTIPVPA